MQVLPHKDNMFAIKLKVKMCKWDSKFWNQSVQTLLGQKSITERSISIIVLYIADLLCRYFDLADSFHKCIRTRITFFYFFPSASVLCTLCLILQPRLPLCPVSGLSTLPPHHHLSSYSAYLACSIPR